MIYLVLGYLVPNTLGGIIVATTGETGYKVMRTILLIDPFFPFYQSLIYTALVND